MEPKLKQLPRVSVVEDYRGSTYQQYDPQTYQKRKLKLIQQQNDLLAHIGHTLDLLANNVIWNDTVNQNFIGKLTKKPVENSSEDCK